MPAPSNPPFVAGALVQPRTLQRWLDVNPVHKLTRAETYITLPAFDFTSSWLGYSNLIGAFDYTSLNNFSIKAVLTTLPALPTNYIACVVWRDSDNVMHRYKLWEGVGEIFYFYIPLYTNQLIRNNFRIEIWDVEPTWNAVVPSYTFVVTGAGTGQINGTYLANINAANATFNGGTFAQIERQGGNNWRFTSVFTGDTYRYSSTNDHFPVSGVWNTPGFYSGVAPNPTITITTPITNAANILLYTSVLQNYDYRYANDVALTTPSVMIDDFSVLLPVNLPITFPANAVPTTN